MTFVPAIQEWRKEKKSVFSVCVIRRERKRNQIFWYQKCSMITFHECDELLISCHTKVHTTWATQVDKKWEGKEWQMERRKEWDGKREKEIRSKLKGLLILVEKLNTEKGGIKMNLNAGNKWKESKLGENMRKKVVWWILCWWFRGSGVGGNYSIHPSIYIAYTSWIMKGRGGKKDCVA